MSASPDLPDDFWTWADAICNESIDEVQLRALSDVLLENRQACSLLAEYSRMHVELYFVMRAQNAMHRFEAAEPSSRRAASRFDRLRMAPRPVKLADLAERIFGLGTGQDQQRGEEDA